MYWAVKTFWITVNNYNVWVKSAHYRGHTISITLQLRQCEQDNVISSLDYKTGGV